MKKFTSLHVLPCLLLIVALSSCQNENKEQAEKQEQETTATKSKTFVASNEPHQYGGWYCPDNFGFVPVDIQKLNEIPVVADRLPTKQELKENKSLIDVDLMKYPDARVLKMDLPRVARLNAELLGLHELVIVIQAIVVQKDTVLGYRFVNGGNGSSRINEVSFLSNEEVSALGSQPFFYSKSVFKASIKDIWNTMRKTEYFKQLGKKFNKQEFFASEWNANSQVNLSLDKKEEKAQGFVGMVFGNYYLQINYNKNGVLSSEKLLMIENQKDQSTELFFASGPFPKDFEKNKEELNSWLEKVKRASEGTY